MTETVETAKVAPVGGKERNKALDITRGFAVLGILLVNIYFAAAPLSSVSFLFLKPDVSPADVEAWTFMQVGLIGVSRGLFSLMFGAGMMLLLDRLSDRFEGKKLRNFFFRRMGILYVIGLIHVFGFMWFGDILNVYALCGIMLYYFRNATTRKLVIFAVIFGLMASAMTLAMPVGLSLYDQAIEAQEAGQELDEDQIAMIEAFDPMMNPVKLMEADADFTEKMLGDFSTTYLAIAGLSVQFLMINFIMVLWDSLFMMVIGIWMYRKGWLTCEASTATYIKMIVIGFGVGLGMRGYWFYEFWQLGYSFDYAMLNMLWAQPTRLFIAVGVIGAVQLFYRAAFGATIKQGIACVGQMALTSYMTHSIVFIILFYGIGFGLYNSLSGWTIFGIGLLVFVAQMIVSPIWLKHFRFGPVEWIWRSLTYGKKQPLKR